MEEHVEREDKERERSCEEIGGAVVSVAEGVGTNEGGGVGVSLFSDSAEEFFSTMETISSLCRLQDTDDTFDQSEMQRLSSMITFLKEWRYFCYEPKLVNFSYETESSEVKEDIKGINLPQFSSATVPERGQSCGVTGSSNSKDFVLHAGGSVWALDWCPTMHEMFDCPIKCEYLAVAAHPPDSFYHKVGSSLTGRGIVQIWCLLNLSSKDESYGERPRWKPNTSGRRGSLGGSNVESNFHPPRPRGRSRKRALRTEPLEEANDELDSPPVRKRGRPRKLPIASEASTVLNVTDNVPPPKRPRGRPRKRTDGKETKDDVDTGEELRTLGFIPPLAVDVTDVENKSSLRRPRGRPRKKPDAMEKEKVDIKVAEDLSTTDFIHSHAVDNVNVKTRSSALRRPRGRPSKRPDKIANVNDPHFFQDLNVTELVPSQSLSNSNTTNVDDPHVIQDLSITEFVPYQPFSDSNRANLDDLHTVQDLQIREFVPTQPMSVLNMENKSSLPKRRRGRPRKGSEMLSDLNGQKPGTQTQKASAYDENDIEVSGTVKQIELGKDSHALTGIDNVVNAANDVLQEPHMDQRISTTNSTNLCTQKSANREETDSSTHPILPLQLMNVSNIENKSSLPKRRRGRPKKGSDMSDLNGQKPGTQIQKASAHDENCIEVSGIVKQIELGKDSNALTRMDSAVNTPNDVLQESHMDQRISTTNSSNLCTQSSNREETYGNTHAIFPTRGMEAISNRVQDALESGHSVAQKRLLDDHNVSLSLQKVIALPRVVLCLGHNGKVAWDVKWRPHKTGDVNFKHRMGYLAVLLGNGSLEVWEVPCHRIIRNLYNVSSKEGTDPRFLKVRPVFICTKLMFGDRQSMPLTMEWSRSASFDRILVGCHDGTVSLWKFSAEDSPQDTRPLLCFTADDAPIRAVAWAPGESDSESANLIVTAGHEGLKFWDVRDPYRPLWDFYPAQRIILSLDWLQHPSCVILSLDDGTMKTLSLSKAAYDVPVTGKPFDGSRHGVVHNYYRSQFAIWSIQVSPITGVAAYCCADGSTLFFQITAKFVHNNRTRYKPSHFLCGALMEVNGSLIINTPMPYTAVPDLPRSFRGLPSRPNSAPAEDPQVQGEDPTPTLGYEDPEPSSRRKTISSTGKHEKSHDENRIVGPLDTIGEEKEENSKIDAMNTEQFNQNFLVLPPKIVAMHRVRWNVNRGSERWLCYGGAAGIIRCQEIALPSDC